MVEKTGVSLVSFFSDVMLGNILQRALRLRQSMSPSSYS